MGRQHSGRAQRYTISEDIFAFPYLQSPLLLGPSLRREILTPAGDMGYWISLSPVPFTSCGFPPMELSALAIEPNQAFLSLGESELLEELPSPPLKEISPDRRETASWNQPPFGLLPAPVVTPCPGDLHNPSSILLLTLLGPMHTIPRIGVI